MTLDLGNETSALGVEILRGARCCEA